MKELPTLMQLRMANNLNSRELADTAGVPFRVEYLAEIGGVVDTHDAVKLLEALSLKTGIHYTLNNVSINVK